MKPAPFGYEVAENKDHAIEILHREGTDARPLAGGQSLVPMMNLRIARPTFLVDLNHCDDLNYIAATKQGLRIGAMTRQRQAELDPVVRQSCPLIAMALSHAGSVPIRNRATVGGSIANGFPLADLIAVALSVDATMVLFNVDGRREVAASDFFIDAMVTALEPGDLLAELVFPVKTPSTRYALRQSGNHASGASAVIVSASAEVREGDIAAVGISIAGVSSTPIRLPRLENACIQGGGARDLAEAYRADLASREYIETGEHAVFVEELGETLVLSALSSLKKPANFGKETRQ